jgi:hypothetical protein
MGLADTTEAVVRSERVLAEPVLRRGEGEPDMGGDTARLDRLARSTRDLLNILALVSGKSAGFRSLSDMWADTTTAHGRLMLTILVVWLSLSASLYAPGRLRGGLELQRWVSGSVGVLSRMRSSARQRVRES